MKAVESVSHLVCGELLLGNRVFGGFDVDYSAGIEVGNRRDNKKRRPAAVKKTQTISLMPSRRFCLNLLR
jgi:hypothetical protein